MEREEERECKGRDSSLVPDQTQMENDEKEHHLVQIGSGIGRPCGLSLVGSQTSMPTGPEQITPIIYF